ncbi:3'5'-cyclic nucleotide phosphodiesterase family protein [Tritrichomonas foetus]|uniref:3'5'-cyclic nucleotide phosphodiesterase family protein n=1 Tax=Tritrichomonas foetus TaxID=1144522 RepID=A0A1J4J815_9EUKA|nr:3'5'-cyclic nucleotide phosphodiesterase family protein [Tritrichomonas foetus]|eukprot:OHS94817.1 3'5'-cyclic nucleotide phosphodiesterase family protein [Tritrichomonas foetus]
MKSKIVKPKGNTQIVTPSCNCTTLLTASQQRDEARAALSMNQKQIANEELFDLFMEDSLVLPLHEAFEPQIRQMFHSEKCVLWIDQPEQQLLISPTFSLTAGYTTSIPGFICKTKNVIQVRDPSQAPGGFLSDPRIASANSPQLFFPISTLGTVRGVVQIVKRQGSGGFSESDMQTASLIMRKFSIYGDSLFTSKSLSKIALSLYSGNCEKSNPLELLQKHFHCHKAELWHFDVVRMSGQIYDPKLHEMMVVQTDDFGLIGFAVTSQSTLNCIDATNNDHYNEKLDGIVEGPALFVSAAMGRRDCWAVALRGRTKQFSTADESQLNALLPFVVRSVAGFSNSEEQSIFNAQLSGLLDVAAMLTSSLNLQELIKTLKEQTQSLLQCEKCVFHLIDQNKKQLVSHSDNPDVPKRRRYPISKGIAGRIVSTKTPISMTDPPTDSYFSPETDSEPGYLPRSLLGAPVFDSNEEVIGVILLLTKIENTSFDDNDQKILIALNVFAGIALENAKLYQTSIKLSQKLRKFVEVTLHTNQDSSLKPLLENIMSNSQKVMQSSRVSLFIVDNYQNGLSLYLNAGEPNKYGSIFAIDALNLGEMVMFDKSAIIERTKTEDENDDHVKLEHLTGDSKISKISSIFAGDQLKPVCPSSIKREKICCIPLFNKENVILGVLENHFLGELSDDDLALVDSFAAIASLALEKIQIKELTILGYGEIDLSDWITQDEVKKFNTPAKLMLEDAEKIFLGGFNASKFDGIGLFKVIFRIFSYFGLMEEFSITNELLFKFLSEIRSTYNKVPYHNWRHAVDTTQFIAYEIVKANIQKLLSKKELLALFIAALCHDADHDEFSNAIDDKSENSLGILYQSQSVLETHHCSVAITILSKDDCNILHQFEPEENKEIWNIIITLILSTDMAQHFHVLGQMSELVSKGEFDLEEKKEHRLIFMQVLHKCGDLGAAARPFEIADPLKDFICEEFFRQGDLDRVVGIVYTPPHLKDREHLDKKKSQTAFYSNVCIPSFEVMAKAMPKLYCNVDQAKNNLNEWKKRFKAEKAQQELDAEIQKQAMEGK